MKRVARVLLVLVFANLVWAGSAVAASEAVSDSEEFTTRTIEYALPYPGILPDSPVYFLKVARDRLVSFMITDRVKKGFYLLLLSDKRLAGGEVLVNTGKTNLGVTTVVNGEEYFSEAVDQAEAARKERKEVGELVAKLTVAATKHEEIIVKMQSKVSGKEADSLAKAYQNNQKSRNRVMGLLAASR